MNRLAKKHRSLFEMTVAMLTLTLFINRCGLLLEYQGECWTEMVPAVIGGTLLATEGSIHLAKFQPPKPQNLFAIDEAINPLTQSAMAAAYCPTLDSYTGTQIRCVTYLTSTPYVQEGGKTLEIRYDSCKFRNRADQVPGYWYMYHRIEFPDAATCNAAKATTDLSTLYSSLNGKTITRGFGMYHPDQTADQHSFRLSQQNEVVSLWSDFKSGWYDPSPVGGVTVKFENGKRILTIKGIHAIGRLSLTGTRYKDTADGTAFNFLEQGVDFRNIANYEQNTDYRETWDHTIDTPKDALYTSTTDPDLANKDYSTITVEGTGSTRKVTSMEKVRIQHNGANRQAPKTVSLSYLKDGQPLEWSSDPNCCWPTSGTIRTDFIERNPLNPRPDWKTEEVKFTSKCGVVQYKGYITVDDTTGLPAGDADYTVNHTLTHCF